MSFWQKEGYPTPKSTELKRSQRGCSQSQSRKSDWQNQSQCNTSQNKGKFFWCGHEHHSDRRECQAEGKTCNKCGRMNHFEIVCGKNPLRKRSQSRPAAVKSSVNELSQNNHDHGTSLASISDNPRQDSYTFMMPKQVVDVVDLANTGNKSIKTFRCHLELDTLSTSIHPAVAPTQIFSNIEIDGVLIHGKQDTGTEINAMPLNVYDQLNQKLNGKLELRSCGDVKVIGYSKQLVKIVGKISNMHPHHHHQEMQLLCN